MARVLNRINDPVRDRWGIRTSFLTLVVLVLSAASVQAGPIFFAGQMEKDKFVPAKDAMTPWYCVRYSTTEVTPGESTARVQVEEVIDGPEQGALSVCVIPLPDGVEGNEVRVLFGAPGEEARVLAATYLSPAKSQPIYEALSLGLGTTKLLALIGRPALMIPKVELQDKRVLTVSYLTPVRRSQDVNWLACTVPNTSWTRSPVERLTLNVHLNTKDPLRTVFSPTHQTTVQRKGLTEATATVKADRFSGLDDFRLFWVADKDALGLRALAFRGSEKEPGYFMLVGNPTGAAGDRVVEKDVLLVMDTSGSMRGEKIEQARSALDYCLEHLNKGDRFNVITFGSEVRSFRDDLVPLNKDTMVAAREFVEGVVANGQTNIAGALEKALAGKPGEGRERIMLFLTDGAPTVGERNPEKILEQVKKLNTNGTKIFVMGVGNDVNAHLLDHLAEVTDGSSEYVAPHEELDAKVASLYDRLSHPVLSGVKVSFGNADAQSVLPSKVPVLFKGSEIMMVGRYKEAGKHTFTISGSLAGKPVKYTCEVDLPRGGSDTTNEFLAPLWAARQIGFLLQQLRLHGANKELIEEVVRLSKQYGIVTEYTDFIAMGGVGGFLPGAGGFGGRVPGPGIPGAKGADLVEEAAKRVNLARNEQAGKWAVTQAANDKDLQQRSVVGGEANAYRDRRGNVTVIRNVVQIGRRAFYLQDGQWVDSEDAGQRKTRVVKLFSPEYMELLKTDTTFAKAQQLGWALSINCGEERIVIEKDGKQKDESLKAKPQPEDVEPGRNQQIPGLPGPNQQQIPKGRNERGLPNQEQIPGKRDLEQLPKGRDQDLLPNRGDRNQLPERKQ